MTTGPLKFTSSARRFFFIDYFRAFLVCLVVLDHAMHAYSEHYARFWFLPDFDRSIFFDVLHLHNDSFMMPSLFFLAGLFTLSSLKRRGYGDFFKERLVRLGIPFIVGVPFICPLLGYPKYKLFQDADISYWDYWTTVFVAQPQAGPFWFLYYLFLLTTLAVFLYALLPSFYKGLGTFCHWVMENPLYGFVCVAGISALLMGFSDLKWGAPWWIGFGKLFYVRGSRFLLKAFLFFLGIGFSEAGFLYNDRFWQKLSERWKQWVFFTGIVGALYMSYTLIFFDTGAYSDEIRRYFQEGGTWEGFSPFFWEFAPGVLCRTTLLTLFILGQLGVYLAVFHRFLQHESPTWQSLALCSYGIYIIHEPFVVWTHWFFNGMDVSSGFKFLISGFGSLFLSWAIVQHILLKIPLLRRIL